MRGKYFNKIVKELFLRGKQTFGLAPLGDQVFVFVLISSYCTNCTVYVCSQISDHGKIYLHCGNKKFF